MSPARYWSVRVDLMVEEPNARDSQFPPAMSQDSRAGDDSSDTQEDESG